MKNFLDYLPPFYSEIRDFNAIADAIDNTFGAANEAINDVKMDFSLSTASEDRLLYWEKILGISADDRTLEQRRRQIAGRLQGGGKLNEAKIKDIVYTFTRGDAIVSFSVATSTITVSIAPPDLTENYRFSDVEASLRPLIPAHLDLAVIRFYNTWSDRVNTYASWQAIKSDFSTWLAVRNTVE